MTNEERFKECIKAKAEKFKGTVQLIGPARRYKEILEDAKKLNGLLMGGVRTVEDDVYDNTKRNMMCIVHFCNIVFIDDKAKNIILEMIDDADNVVITGNGCPRMSFTVNDVWQ